VSELKLHMMMSLDGSTAAPEQSTENPFGIAGDAAQRVALPAEGVPRAASVEGWFRWAATCSAAAPDRGTCSRITPASR
jgi:hypothetical protein